MNLTKRQFRKALRAAVDYSVGSERFRDHWISSAGARLGIKKNIQFNRGYAYGLYVCSGDLKEASDTIDFAELEKRVLAGIKPKKRRAKK